jgi:hypothetical protein
MPLPSLLPPAPHPSDPDDRSASRPVVGTAELARLARLCAARGILLVQGPLPAAVASVCLDLRLTIWPDIVEVVEGDGALRLPTATITQVERSPWNEELTLHTTEGRMCTCALPPAEIEHAQAVLAQVMARPGAPVD